MNKTKILNPKDAAGITSSTESETFETWTLVTPKSKAKTKPDSCVDLPNLQEANECRIDKIKKDENHTDGELSDGISVISDSESAGRASPQPAPRRNSPVKRINAKKCDLNENDSDNPDSIQETEQYAPITPPRTPDHVELSPSEATATESTLQLPIESEFRMGINLKYIFYVTAFIAFVAVLSNIRIPEMNDEKLHYKIDLLVQKVDQLKGANLFLENKLDDLSMKIKQTNQFINEEITLEYGKIITVRHEDDECSVYLFAPRRDTTSGKIIKVRDQKCSQYNGHVCTPTDFLDYLGKLKYENFRKYTDPKWNIEFGSMTRNAKQNQPQETSEEPNQNNEYEIRKNNKRKFENHANNDRKHDDLKPERTTRRNTIKDEDDWHEKMMRHREEIRKQHEPYGKREGGSADDNNWYLDRGNGRRDARKPEKKEKRS